ncbi:DNA repair protein RAD10 [Aspergillus puulaauensis]|uniref:SsDNA endonuclease and repair protein rad10 n=1 Tax=Aspergillus puulaauensis TaxID=1220207 RepID=A0A7R8AS95_9EURO|nr:ssDNA endonuclease and repair protein rad10 [Aspergillus puulaauensis]BCS28932.1 ssDNA endonuclease and repair protein rad10 [Aspergillus puulaauensis]
MAGEFGDNDAGFESVIRAEAAGQPRASGASTTQSASERAPQSKVQQPKPQALASKPGPSGILVSTRQKGNPILNHIKVLPWEYADIPADYVLGATTCALFLSLKYHRLHPEYIYSRIKLLAGKYLLRVLLIIVDIPNHEESLKELSKTSIINNLTLVLCWSAPEAAHYLELFKSSEHSQPTAIRTQQAQSYKDSLVEFVTAPRSINKSDAASLISTFGSLQNAINAQPEQISAVPGWGEKKVRQWCNAVREDFRVEKTKGASAPTRSGLGRAGPSVGDGDITMSNATDAPRDAEDENIFAEAHESTIPRQEAEKDEDVTEGIAAALAKLRENGS